MKADRALTLMVAIETALSDKRYEVLARPFSITWLLVAGCERAFHRPVPHVAPIPCSHIMSCHSRAALYCFHKACCCILAFSSMLSCALC